VPVYGGPHGQRHRNNTTQQEYRHDVGQRFGPVHVAAQRTVAHDGAVVRPGVGGVSDRTATGWVIASRSST
jgi:hypothetical protein